MAQYIWPVPKGTGISQPFGASPGGFNPAGGHTGTDFLTPLWTPVRAIADGTVKQAGWLAGTYLSNPWWLEPSFAGIVVAIDHGPLVSIYAHLISTGLNPGDRVRQGDLIGYSGNTRNGIDVFGPHLHFETIPDGWSFTDGTFGRRNPANYCTGYFDGNPSPTPPAPPKPTPAPAPPVQKDWFDMATANDLKNALREVIKEPAILDLIALAFLQRDCYLVDPTAKTTAITGSTTLAKKINWAAYNNAKLLTILVAIAGNLGIATELIEDLPEALAAQLATDAGGAVEAAPESEDK